MARFLRSLTFADVVLGALVFTSDLAVTRVGLPSAARWLVLLPLWGVCGALVVCSRSVALALRRFPTSGIAAWAAVALLSTTWSLVPARSILQGAGMASLVVGATWYVTLLGWDRFATVFAASGSAFLVFGFVAEVVDGSQQSAGYRLSGLTFGPTSMGVFAAFLFVMGVDLALDRSFGRARSALGAACATMAAVAMVWSNARGAMTAVGAAMAVVVVWRLGRWRSFWFGAAALAVALVLTALTGFRPSDLSRTGDTTELVTLTGRTDVWAIAIDRIRARPVTGYGTGSSHELFVEAASDGRIFWRPFDAHNVWLSLAIEQGLLAMLLFLAGILGALRRWRALGPWPLAALVVFVVNGSTEALTFRPTAALLVAAAVAARAASPIAASERIGLAQGVDAAARSNAGAADQLTSVRAASSRSPSRKVPTSRPTASPSASRARANAN